MSKNILSYLFLVLLLTCLSDPESVPIHSTCKRPKSPRNKKEESYETTGFLSYLELRKPVNQSKHGLNVSVVKPYVEVKNLKR